MSRLTLAEERAMLADARRLRRVSIPEYERWLQDRLGVARVDQIKAASADALRSVKAMADVPPFSEQRETGAWGLGVMLFAGVTRCLAQSRCAHAVDGGRPLLAMLAARVIACDRCLPRYRGAIAAATARIAAGEDRLCDFCLEEPADGWFRPTLTHFGPVRVFGDVCRRCWTSIEEGRAAA